MQSSYLLADIRSYLAKQFPQLQSKSTALSLYMGYDFPEKQVKMYIQWQRILSSVANYLKTLFVSLSQLTEIMQFHSLKPSSLPKLYQQMVQQKILVERSRILEEYTLAYRGQDLIERTNAGSSGIVSKVFGLLWKSKPPVKKQAQDTCVLKRKLDHSLESAHRALLEIYSSKSSLQDLDPVSFRLQQKLGLDVQSVALILQILERQGFVKQVESRVQNRAYKMLLYRQRAEEITPELIEVEKSKKMLENKLVEIDLRTNLESNKIRELYSKTKQCYESGNKTTAKMFYEQKILHEDFLSKLMIRRKVIANTIHQIEEAESNSDIVELLVKSQELIKQRQVDRDTLIDIQLDQQEITKQQNEANEVFKSLNQKEQKEVDALMLELQKELVEQGAGEKHVQIPVAMEIQEQPLQNNRNEDVIFN